MRLAAMWRAGAADRAGPPAAGCSAIARPLPCTPALGPPARRRCGFRNELRRIESVARQPLGGRTTRRLHVASSYEDSREREGSRGGPTSSYSDADYSQSSPSPPPPPPPPPPKRQKRRGGVPVWLVVAMLLLGSGVWWWFIDSTVPQVYKDEDGFQYVRTKGGNKVLVGEDPDGRVYMVDQAGNFYYDSGDPDVGVYVVTGDDKVFNLFEAGGERQQVFVGQFSQLRTQRIASLGGIPIEDFRRAYDKSFDGTITAFTAPALKGEEPTAADFGGRVPPAIVEYEPEIVVEEKPGKK